MHRARDIVSCAWAWSRFRIHAFGNARRLHETPATGQAKFTSCAVPRSCTSF